MLERLYYSILAVLIVSLISFIGLFTIKIKESRLRRILTYFVSFSAGALIGDSFIHLLPEASEEGFGLMISFSVIFGILFSFIVEKFIHWRHCHINNHKEHKHPFAYLNLIGDAVHNFIDGLIIMGSFLVSVPVGIATSVAVIFHEIPQEIGDFGVLLAGGFKRGKALFLNFLTALTSVFGVLVAFFASRAVENFSTSLVGFAAGTFIYIAAADLIPELHREVRADKSATQLLFFVFGILVMIGLLGFEL